jgi:hypothetical protein
MKIWKLKRDNNKLIIQQIDWLSRHQGIDLNADDIKSLYGKTKQELIEIWVANVESAGHPQLEWLEIYY